MERFPSEDFYPFGLRGRQDVICPMDSPHRHLEVELFSVDDGPFERDFGGRVETFSKDEIVLFWALTPHQLTKIAEPGHGFIAYFPLEAFLHWKLPPAFVRKILGGQSLRVTRNATVEAVLDALRHWLPAPGALNRSLLRSEYMILEGCLGVLAEEALNGIPDLGDSKSLSNQRHLMEMIEFVAHNRSQNLGSDDVCKHVGLHPAYGRALFKKTAGLTIHQFMINHRIEHAKKMLAMTDLLILDVALDSGFGSLSRFHAVFKDRVGQTPRAFRQQVLNQG